MSLSVSSAGEGVIQNNSSREIKPKYSLYWKHSFFAMGRRRVNTNEVLKEVGEPIQPNARQTVTKVLNLPQDIAASILNCSILKAEYRLKVCISNTCVFFLEHITPCSHRDLSSFVSHCLQREVWRCNKNKQTSIPCSCCRCTWM